MLLEPHDRHLGTTIGIRLGTLLLSCGRTYFVVTADPVYVFSRSWNLMRFREGVAGAAFQ